MIEWVLALAGAGILFLGFVVRARGRQLKEYVTLHNSDTKVITEHAKLREALEAELEKSDGLLVVHRGQNEEFERQRTQVWQLYRTAGLQMGNAQAMLLSELQRLTLVLNAYREKLGGLRSNEADIAYKRDQLLGATV